MAANKQIPFVVLAIDPTSTNAYFLMNLVFNAGTGTYDAYIQDTPNSDHQSLAANVPATGVPLSGTGGGGSGITIGQIVNGGTPGEFLFVDGLGNLDNTALDFADTDLSNLIATAINQSLNPDAPNTLELGAPLFQWLNAYLSGSLFLGGNTNTDTQLLDVGARLRIARGDNTDTPVGVMSGGLACYWQNLGFGGPDYLFFQPGTNGYLGLFEPTAPKIRASRTGNAENGHDSGIEFPQAGVAKSTDGGAGTGDFQAENYLDVNGVQVVTTQQPAIADPTGGVVIDAEARASIVDILAALRTHGLIDT